MSSMRPREQQALDYVREMQPVSRAELAQRLGCRPRTAGQYLWKLRCAGKIESDSVGRFAVWSVADRKTTIYGSSIFSAIVG